MKSLPIAKARQKIKKLRKDLTTLENAGRFDCFSITKLRTISSLCKDEEDLCHFAFFIANKVADSIFTKIEEKAKIKEAVEEAIHLMSLYLENPTKDIENAINSHHSVMQKYQNKTRNATWGTQVRTINNWDFYLIEACLNCFLWKHRPEEGYRLAKDYCEKYNPSRGTGLIPESIPFLTDVVEFWEGWYLK
ncbi:MAG: hypothetical protein AAGG68_29955 [Bacteroidota bacterium]